MDDFPLFYILLTIGWIWLLRDTFGSKARREWRGFFARRQREGPYRYILRRERERKAGEETE